MNTTKALLTTAALASFVAGAIAYSGHAQAKEGFEMCSGIVKAGHNDCKANGHSCAGQSTKDGAANEWVYVPTGTCDKIVGGTVVKPAM